jgi:hypothetical protein
MQNIKPEFVEQTLAVWQRRSVRTLVADDAGQILDNICGFFGVLSEWTRRDQRGSDRTKQLKPSSMRKSTQ